MRKWLIFLLAVLLMLPAIALADLEYHLNNRPYVTFPTLDGLQAKFPNASTVRIVTPENLDRHLPLLLARGDTEEEIRARFARESMVFEAYCPELPADACFRVEVYENDITRNVWHARHLDNKARQELVNQINMGYLMEDYYIFDIGPFGSGENSALGGCYTSYPPARLEAGRVQLHFRNGKLYLFMYSYLDRLHLAKDGTKKDDYGAGLFSSKTHFTSQLLPQLTPFELDETFPTAAVPGKLTITGKVREGGALTATLDGERAECKVNGNGKFTATFNLTGDGDHEVKFVATHQRNTTREETYTINVSSNRTHLHLSNAPEGYAKAGTIRFKGTTDPDADLVLQLDDEEPITVDVDSQGAFSHEFVIRDSKLHKLHVQAEAPDKDTATLTIPFYTVFETVYDGLNAYMKKLNTTPLKTIAQTPDDYIGERVKVQVQVKKMLFTETGLGLLCEVYGSPIRNQPLIYVTVYGYADMWITEGNILTVYGTVEGVKDVEGEEAPRLDIHMQYGAFDRW